MNQYQKIELAVGTIVFIFIFGFFRQIILYNKIDSLNIVITTTLFFIWYFMTLITTDFIMGTSSTDPTKNIYFGTSNNNSNKKN